MDIFAITKVGTTLAENLTKKYSTFTNTESNTPPPSTTSFNVANILGFILGVVIGLCAAYLSWQCNTSLDYNVFLKVIFAILAYMFGFVYLILYLIMRWDTCSVIAKTRK